MFKVKGDAELTFDSREMQKAYFEPTQGYPGYYAHQGNTQNGYAYDGQMGYNGTPPPPAENHYRGNYPMQGGNPGSQASGPYGSLDYSQHYNPQCGMPPNMSPTLGMDLSHGQPPMLHPGDPTLLKGMGPHGMGPGAGGGPPGHLPGGPPMPPHPHGPQGGQEIYPWMKEHRQNKRPIAPTPPQGPGECFNIIFACIQKTPCVVQSFLGLRWVSRLRSVRKVLICTISHVWTQP